MIEIEVAVLVVLLLIIILIIYKVRKRISKKAKPEPNLKTTGSAKQSQEIKPGDDPVFHAELKSKLSGEPKADESVFNAKPQSGHSVEIQPDEPVINTDPSIASQTNETAIPAPENRYENLPQDSMLRRHYLTHLHALVESRMPPRPTDSTLRRHYDSMIEYEVKNLL